MKKRIITKSRWYSKIFYRIGEPSEMIRYSLSFFITGVILLFVTFSLNKEALLYDILPVLSSFCFIIGIYAFPFWNFNKATDVIKRISSYSLYICFITIYSMFWFSLSGIMNKTPTHYLFITVLTILEVIFVVVAINFTLKPIILVVSKISDYIKTKANKNEESKYLIFFKPFSANVGIVISFILSIFTFISTIVKLFSGLFVINT